MDQEEKGVEEDKMANLTNEEKRKLKILLEDYIECLDPYDYSTKEEFLKEKEEVRTILDKLKEYWGR